MHFADVWVRSNAVALDSVHVMSHTYFRLAQLALQARQIKRQTLLERLEKVRHY